MLRALVVLTTSATVLVAPAAVAASSTTFPVGGTGQLIDTGVKVPPMKMAGMLSGKYAAGTIHDIDYPATIIGMDRSVAIGAERLTAAIQAEPDDKIAFGVSQGAIVLSETKKNLMALPEDQRPAPANLEFVQVGDPSRPGGGALRLFNYQQPPETPYDTTYITREYDGFADLPDDLWNVPAVLNAAMGIVYIHPNYGKLPDDIPAENIKTTVNSLGGKTTDILIPTEKLPLLQPLRDLKVDERIVREIEKPLKQIVDAGYHRNSKKADDEKKAVEKDDEPTKVEVKATGLNAKGGGTKADDQEADDTGAEATAEASESASGEE